jgi:hypothetical protein
MTEDFERKLNSVKTDLILAQNKINELKENR